MKFDTGITNIMDQPTGYFIAIYYFWDRQKEIIKVRK